MNRIKELRKEKGLTLDEIQSKTGINRSTYNNYENGKTEPKPETWQALADYFNVSVPYLQGKIFKEDLSDEAQEMCEVEKDSVEENHNLEKIIEDAKEYRWYSIPDMYMVEILDTTGRSAGYAKSIFIDKKEAAKVAKRLHGIVRQVSQNE